MVITKLFFLVVGLISQTSLCAVPTPAPCNSTDEVPRTYIIQLKSDTALQSNQASTVHDAFHNICGAKGLKYSTRHTFSDDDLFLGLSLTVEDDADLATLASIESVAGIWPVLSVPRPSAALLHHRPSNRTHHHPRGGKNPSSAPCTAVKVNSTTSYCISSITGNLDVNRPLTMSGIDKIHATGNKGKGIKIAVFDTGVDFRHPSLGGCFGPGCKVSFGYDFVGDGFAPPPGGFQGSPIPLATCPSGGHGTHVMGIIGMEDQLGTGFGLIGVAPEATFGMYRIFPCVGNADTDTILAAMNRAAADGADVLSMSFGQIGTFLRSDPYQLVTDGLASRGIAMFAANGNDGNLGLGFASIPGIETGVFAVGSIMNEKFPVTYQAVDSLGTQLTYSSTSLPINTTLKVQVLNFGGTADQIVGCRPGDYESASQNLTAQNQTPSNYILAVSRAGPCGNLNKSISATQQGYPYILFYDAITPREYNAVDAEDPRSILYITEDSKTLLAGYGQQRLNYTLSFSNTAYNAASPLNLAGGLMSNFSTFGPTNDFRLKPQLSAPGGLILSTFVLENEGYAVMSGTSMATPFMAGCYALIKSQNPTLTVNETYSLMMNVGKPVPWFYDPSMLSSAVHQGPGLIDAYKAITSETLILPSQLSLPNTLTTTANITIKNRSNKPKTYTLGHMPAGLADFSNALTAPLFPIYANITFETPSIDIPANSAKDIVLRVVPPMNVHFGASPIYSGFVIVTDEVGNYTVPYIGRPWN